MSICTKHPELMGERDKQYRCVQCKRDYATAWGAKNRDRLNAVRKAWRDRNLEREKAKIREYFRANPRKLKRVNLRKRNFTLELYDAALSIQHFNCAICGTSLLDLPPNLIHADHSHSTGKPRGVLCQHCNTGLGCFTDDTAKLKAAIHYLSNPPLGDFT